MENGETGEQPILSHAEPVLAVSNVADAIEYWQNVLGFPNKWAWGEPPTLGAVSWHGAFIQFVQNAALAAASKGNYIWIRVQRVSALYALHQKNGTEIVAPLENQPYGLAQYVIRDPNGYYVCFAGHIDTREKSGGELPGSIRIIERHPTAKEYAKLGASAGWWASMADTEAEQRLAAAVFAVVAEDTASGEAIGCALLLGDQHSFYYVKDVVVLPAWQAKRVGMAMMHTLTDWLELNAAENALVGLFTGEMLEPFYQQFGFTKAFGMIRYMQRKGV